MDNMHGDLGAADCGDPAETLFFLLETSKLEHGYFIAKQYNI